MNRNLRIYCIYVFMATIVKVGSNSSSSGSSDNEQNSEDNVIVYQEQYLGSAQANSASNSQEDGSTHENSFSGSSDNKNFAGHSQDEGSGHESIEGPSQENGGKHDSSADDSQRDSNANASSAGDGSDRESCVGNSQEDGSNHEKNADCGSDQESSSDGSSAQESSASNGQVSGSNHSGAYQASNSSNPPFQNFVPSSRRMTAEQQSNTPDHDNHASIISIFSQIEENVKSAISANEQSEISRDQLYGIHYCKVIIHKYRNEIFKGFYTTDFVFANCVYDLTLILIAREKKMYDVILGNHKINGRNVCDEIMQNGFLCYKLMTAIERNFMGLSEYSYQFPDVQKALEEYTTIKILVSLIPDFIVGATKVYSFNEHQELLINSLMVKFEGDKLDYKVRYPTVVKTYVDSLAGHMTPDRIGQINQSPEEIDKIHANVSTLCLMVHHYLFQIEQSNNAQSVVQDAKNEKVEALRRGLNDENPSRSKKIKS